MKGRVLRRSFALCLAACLTAAAVPRAERPAEALIAEILSPRSGLERNLRVLTDEIGGRVAGSAACERAPAWGQMRTYGPREDWESGRCGRAAN